MTSENSNSLPKEEAIEQLRKTIGQLENIIEQLDETSVINLPDPTAIENLVATTTELEKVIPKKENQEVIKPEIAEETTIVEEKITSTPEFKVNIVEPIPVESEIETEPISETPITNQPQQSSKKKWLVIGVVTALIIAIIPLSWKFLKSNEVPQIITRNTPQTIIKTNPDLSELAQNIPEENKSYLDSNSSAEIIATPEEDTTQPETIITNEIPSELEIESKPQKVAIETVKPTKKLSPEQNLVAAIESEAINLANRYSEDLIMSIKPNFTDSMVTVTLADDWYQLAANRQDKITEEMLKRSRQLEFKKLKITDSQNNLIARSPIVGDNIVIFRRTI